MSSSEISTVHRCGVDSLDKDVEYKLLCMCTMVTKSSRRARVIHFNAHTLAHSVNCATHAFQGGEFFHGWIFVFELCDVVQLFQGEPARDFFPGLTGALFDVCGFFNEE